MPYDGMSDLYREIAFHGGIPNLGFVKFWNAQARHSRGRAEDWVKAMEVHPLLDEYWQSKMPPVEQIGVPTYVIASWTDHAVHTRGSLAAYMRLGSEQKWLEVHGRNKWARMYDAESVRRQLAFFDRFLKGAANEVDDWPKEGSRYERALTSARSVQRRSGHLRALNTCRSTSMPRATRCRRSRSMRRSQSPMR